MSALLLTFSSASFAGSYHHHNYKPKACNKDKCDNAVSFHQEFTTTDFTKNNVKKGWGWSKDSYSFSFDPIVAPSDDFWLTDVDLSIETDANGWFDFLYADNNGYWKKIDSFVLGNESYDLSKSLFDDVIDGVAFKLVIKSSFFDPTQSIFSATLDVDGKYCPPEISEVPVPAAAFLFAPALVGFMAVRRKANKA